MTHSTPRTACATIRPVTTRHVHPSYVHDVAKAIRDGGHPARIRNAAIGSLDSYAVVQSVRELLSCGCVSPEAVEAWMGRFR